jgi:hypothetical protein
MIRCLYSLDRPSASRFAPIRSSTPRQRMAHFHLFRKRAIAWRDRPANRQRQGGQQPCPALRGSKALGLIAWGRSGSHEVDRIGAPPKIVRDIGWKAQVRLARPISSAGRAAAIPPCRQPRFAPRWSASSGRSLAITVAALHKGPNSRPAEYRGHCWRVFSRRSVLAFSWCGDECISHPSMQAIKGSGIAATSPAITNFVILLPSRNPRLDVRLRRSETTASAGFRATFCRRC